MMTWFRTFFVFKICVVLNIVLEVKSDCSTVFAHAPTFGPDCSFRCRCKNDVQCDVTTGECPDGCIFGWMGPACQYRNLVKDYTDVRQFGEGINAEESAETAADGDVATCSWSDPRSYEGRQYWMVELNREYRVVGLVLHILDSDLENFEEFQVEFGPFWSSFQELCYVQDGTPETSRLEIMCEQPMITQYIRIILNVTGVPIRLCEVEIYGGRDVSFNKKSSGSTPYQNWRSHKAVDGHFLELGGRTEYARSETCYASVPTANPRWSLDLGAVYEIQGLLYYGRENNYLNQMKGFQVSLANATSNFTTIYTDDEDTGAEYVPREITLTDTVTGSVLQIVRKKIFNTQLAVCEVAVFAECPVDKCGWDCSTECHCSTSYVTGSFKITGTCPYGCKDRWTGIDGRCEIECCSSMWGPECENQCGHCETLPCDIADGSCPDGCTGAWQPPLCVEECEDGTYGLNCSEECGHCMGRTACDKTSGVCLSGCEEGWVTPYCQEAVDPDAVVPDSFTVGIGVGALSIAVLIEAITIAVLCRYRRLRLTSDNVGACALSWKSTEVPGQTEAQ